MKKRDWIEQIFYSLIDQNPEGVTARQIGAKLGLDRSTASRYLNDLVRLGRADKRAGRPVRYLPKSDHSILQKPAPAENRDLLDDALAALLYPPSGLPILFTGETGVGKTYMAKKLAKVAIKKNYFPQDTPFVAFNCAEYAQNPELLLAQLFGVKKGAYTGASENRAGLVERANGGILFLDEIHRLPPSGQEMLFYLIDQGTYRRLGETSVEHPVQIRLIGATTETPEKVLLPALTRRFSVQIEIPPLRNRPVEVREQLVENFFAEEAKKTKIPITVSKECRTRLLTYPCLGNIGQLKSDIQIACARAFLRHINRSDHQVQIRLQDLPASLRKQGWVSATVEAQIEGSSSSQEKHVPNHTENIYSQLLDTKEQLEKQNVSAPELNRQLQETVNKYVSRLISSAKRNEALKFKDTNLFQNILQIIRQSVRDWEHPCSRSVTDTQINALALHIHAFLKQPNRRPKKTLNQLEVEPVYRQLAQKIAIALNENLNADLPQEELDLISLFFSLQQSRQTDKPRVIATVCLTGEGAAVSLELWLKQHLPNLDQDVLVRSVQIDPVDRESKELDRLAKNYHLVAVVGTVPPKIKNIPYIPVWELYHPHGLKKLEQLLTDARPLAKESKPDHEEIFHLMEQGLRETVIHFNPKKFIELIKNHRTSLSETFRWTAEHELGIWMHLAIYTDQLLEKQLTRIPAKQAENGEHPSFSDQSTYLWQNLLLQLENVFSVKYPSITPREMTRLSSA